MSNYRPKAFAVDERAQLVRFMQAHPFATLVTFGGRILTTHIPVLSSHDGEAIVIRGHIARANDQWKDTDAQYPAAVLFRGSSHYISPNWYPSKREHGRVVPTYDYEVVEARGRIRFFEDPHELRALVTALTIEHERSVGEAWTIEDAPHSYIDAMLSAIVGFEMHVEELAGSYKLSQNRSQADRDGVSEGLEALGTPDARFIAERVRGAGGQ